jgi:WD40 repeat protein
MGVVYKARQEKLKRLVALKMILDGDYASSKQRARFRTEAEAVARLEHPHIVRIHEIGDHEGRPYFALEFVEGGNLERKLDGTPLPPQQAARLVQLLAEATHAAHLKGIVHRDLKPANILLARSNSSHAVALSEPNGETGWYEPKITDFGLAKKLDDDEAHTKSGTVVGTPSYMAPEQAAGKTRAIGPAADVYALGAILYELLTGRPPFKGAMAVDTILQVLSEEPVAPSRLQPKLPKDLETICLRCLQKEPAKRYASAEALAVDLRHFLAGEPITARPVSTLERAWKWSWRRPAAAALLASAALTLIALLGGSIWFAQHTYRQRLQAEELQGQADLARDATERARQDAQKTAAAEAQARSDAQDQQRAAEQATLRARHEAADLALERGLSLCEQGDVRVGLLWLGRSQVYAPPDAEDLRRTARANISTWCRRVHVLKQAIPIGPDSAQSLAISPDGSTFLVASYYSREAHQYDLVSGAPVGEPLKHDGVIYGVAFSRDGKTLLTAGADKCVRRWRAGSGAALGEPLNHQATVYAVAASPDDKIILTGSADKTAQRWDAATGKPIGKPLPHPRAVRAVGFSPDGKRFATGTLVQNNDAELRVWETATGLPVGDPIMHRTEVRALAWSPDGRFILTCGDNQARFWEVATRSVQGSTLNHGSGCWGIAFSPDGKRVLTASQDYKFRLWNAETRQLIGQPLHHPGWTYSVAFHPNGKTFLTGGADVQVWETNEDRPEHTILDLPSDVWQMAFSADGRFVLVSSSDRTVRLCNGATGKVVGEAMSHPNGISHAVLSADGKLALTGCWDRWVRSWDARSGKLLRSLYQPSHIEAVALSPDGQWALIGGRDGKARLWDLSTGKLTRTLEHEGVVTAAAFSPDNRTCVTGTQGFRVRRWEVATGRSLGKDFSLTGAISTLALSGDNRWLLAGTRGDLSARLGDLTLNQAVGPHLPHRDELSALAISADSKFLLTASFDGTARLWDAATGKALGPPLRHTGQVKAVLFCPDGHTILTAGNDKMVRRHQIPIPVEGTPEQIGRWIQVRTGMGLDEYGGPVSFHAVHWQKFQKDLERLGGPPKL